MEMRTAVKGRGRCSS